MNNVFVYCEIEGTTVKDVSLELLTKGRKLADTLGVKLECIIAGSGLDGVEQQVIKYGVDKDDPHEAPATRGATYVPHLFRRVPDGRGRGKARRHGRVP